MNSRNGSYGQRLAAGALAMALGQATALAADCAQLAQPHALGAAEVRSARAVAADAASEAPAYCEVTAVVKPVEGSEIVTVVRLPERWNGRMLGLGGGGWAGNLLLATALPGLKRGYATAQTDGGHPSPNGIDASWTKNPVAVTDFSHRAIHEMTVLGKQVVKRHYGRDANRNYFQGCSTGGRMGMMESQRYPADYDGIVAGAPVYTLLTQTSPVVRRQIFIAPGAGFSAMELERVNAASLAACDGLDGVKDGVVSDPQRCTFDPAVLRCKAGETKECLSEAQVDSLRKAYQTTKGPDGLVGNYGMTRGSEAGWARFVAVDQSAALTPMNGGLGDLIPLIFSNQKYDAATFDPRKQQAAVHKTPFAAEYEATSTDLGPFVQRGGKLLLWHGFDDPGPSAFATIDYYEKAVKANGAANLQLFLAPGVYHCAGGPGPDDFDLLTAIENWVEKGQKPERIVARNRRTSETRPLCAWPGLPQFDGKGSSADEHNFSCRASSAKR
ncbi:MAG: tannase/feruloyl esterase family alpha/beta hydrolase [Steroidobacteraceae bacterium]